METGVSGAECGGETIKILVSPSTPKQYQFHQNRDPTDTEHHTWSKLLFSPREVPHGAGLGAGGLPAQPRPAPPRTCRAGGGSLSPTCKHCSCRSPAAAHKVTDTPRPWGQGTSTGSETSRLSRTRAGPSAPVSDHHIAPPGTPSGPG